MSVPSIPPGYHAVTPYLIVKGGAQALAWYAEAFGARELLRLPAPNDKVGHAEIEIGDSRIMLADEVPDHEANAPGAYGGSPVSLHLYVDDVDATVIRAVGAGAKIKSRPQDKFYGDRMGTVVDPFGHTWHIATHFEDVSPQEITRRMVAMTSPA
jgi:PhnB protein